jgi:RNA polymerase sigma factor (sigma-70 family)
LVVDEETKVVPLSDVSDLLALAPRARAVLFLSAVEGYSYEEIGGAVGCSEAAARKIASRARRRLRTMMTAEEVGDANA